MYCCCADEYLVFLCSSFSLTTPPPSPAVPFAVVSDVADVTDSASQAGCNVLARALTFLSLVLRQQPSGLDLFHQPAPYVWTNSAAGMASRPRTQLLASHQQVTLTLTLTLTLALTLTLTPCIAPAALAAHRPTRPPRPQPQPGRWGRLHVRCSPNNGHHPEGG